MLVFAVVPTFFSAYVILLVREYEHLLQGGEGFVIFFSFATFTMAFALTPTTFIAILSGYFFSWLGIIGVVLAYLVASLLGLWFGKKINTWFVGGFLGEDEKLQLFFSRLKENTLLMVIFGRLSPVLPFSMMNIAFASIKVPLKSYLVGSLLGMFPRTFIFFYAGMNVKEIWAFLMDPTLEGFTAIVPVILVIVSSAGLLWLGVRSWKKSYGLP